MAYLLLIKPKVKVKLQFSTCILLMKKLAKLFKIFFHDLAIRIII
jgi:hypothetical protein